MDGKLRRVIDTVKRAEELLAGTTPGEWHLMPQGFSWKVGHGYPTVYATDEELRYIAVCADFANIIPTPNLQNAAFIAAAPSLVRQLCEEVKRLEEGMEKINAIRNSIVGAQTLNWSEHIYPLVAALNEAGMKGLDYNEARANLGTLRERAEKAETELTTLRDVVEKVREEAESMVERGMMPSTRAYGSYLLSLLPEMKK